MVVSALIIHEHSYALVYLVAENQGFRRLAGETLATNFFCAFDRGMIAVLITTSHVFGIISSFTSADTYHIADGIDKDLTVARLSGVRTEANGANRFINLAFGESDVNFGLGDEITEEEF